MKLNARMILSLPLAAALTLLPAQSSLADTYQFFGRTDANFPAFTPTAEEAFDSFTASLSSWGTDDIENAEDFDPSLTFGATGITATTSGVMAQIAPSFTSSGIKALLETDAATLSPALNTVFNLSAPVTAFGLFVTQGGDGANNNPVTFVFENTATLSSKPVIVQVGPGWGVTNQFFFGYADTFPFNKVTLIETTDLNDGMLYDDITVGALVPEPSSIVLLGTAALFGLVIRRRDIARLVRR